MITVHAEACRHLDRTIRMIKEQDIIAGVALNPSTPLSAIEYLLPVVDMVLIMTVNPGYGGQKLISYTLDKIRDLKKMIDSRGLKTDIEVDGGITMKNLGTVMDAGANIIVLYERTENGSFSSRGFWYGVFSEGRGKAGCYCGGF